MSVDLRPPLLDEVGLVPALRAYLDAQSALSGVAMELEEGTEKTPLRLDGRLPPDLEIACFRVVQESITNALRHASARHVSVLHRAADGRRHPVDPRRRPRLRRRPARWISPPPSGHLGVVGMRERVRARGRHVPGRIPTPAWGRR